MSMCRFGDGEFIFLNDIDSPIILPRFCRNWGFAYPEDLPKAEGLFVPILMNALSNTNFIGILDPESEEAKLKINAFSLHRWSTSLEHLRRLHIDPAKLRVFNFLLSRSRGLGSPEGMKLLLNHEPVHILSCRTKALQDNELNLLLDTKVSYTQVDSDLPLTAETRKWLIEKVHKIEEFVVLVALGPVGKDLPVILKENGKIGIDMGATIDAWASVVSRPTFRTTQRHCFVGELPPETCSQKSRHTERRPKLKKRKKAELKKK